MLFTNSLKKNNNYFMHLIYTSFPLQCVNPKLYGANILQEEGCMKYLRKQILIFKKSISLYITRAKPWKS